MKEDFNCFLMSSPFMKQVPLFKAKASLPELTHAYASCWLVSKILLDLSELERILHQEKIDLLIMDEITTNHGEALRLRQSFNALKYPYFPQRRGHLWVG